jgi:hypothetical protein
VKRACLTLAFALTALSALAAGPVGTKQNYVLGQMFNAHGNFGFVRSAGVPFTCSTVDMGALYYDTLASKPYFCDGSTWSAMSASSPLSGAFLATGTWTFGSAVDAAGSVRLGETASCVVFEGATADANETSVCAADPSADTTINFPAFGAGTYTLATLTGTETLSGKTLTTPTIASFANATHDHTNAAGGGTLNAGTALGAGQVSVTRGGTGSDLSGTGGTEQFIKQGSVGGALTAVRPTCSTLSNAAASCSTDTTSASNISTGTLGLARGGTNANLSATGGANQFLSQASSGAAITVVQPTCSSLSNAAASCSTDATNMSNAASGTLSLTRGGTGANNSGIAKGGLIVGTGAGAASVLPVGSDGCVPYADSTQTNGITWTCKMGLYYIKTGLVNNTPTSILRLTVASGTMTGAVISWRITATDGTDFQERTGVSELSCQNKAGSITVGANIINTATGSAIVPSGTQTVTSNGLDTGSGACDFQVSSNSSLAGAATTVTFSFMNLGAQATSIL